MNRRKSFSKNVSPWKLVSKSLKKSPSESLIIFGLGSKVSYPTGESQYSLYEQVGCSLHAETYRALCKPFNEVVAVKILNLENCVNLDDISYGMRTIAFLNHPNIMQVYCSFLVQHYLWMVMPFMDGSSCLYQMKASFQAGFEEEIVAAFLKEVLKGLFYIHSQGQVHQNIKVGNILANSNGVVVLADFWFPARAFACVDGTQGAEKTAYWLAPEIVQQTAAYSPKADIWSVGVAALELSHGPGAFKNYSSTEILKKDLQKRTRGGLNERHKRFSKSFLEMVSLCLASDPAKRPSAKNLLRHGFFLKYSEPTKFLVSGILGRLPPLAEQLKALKIGDGVKHGFKNVFSGEKKESEQENNSWIFELDSSEISAMVKDKNDIIQGLSKNMELAYDHKSVEGSKLTDWQKSPFSFHPVNANREHVDCMKEGTYLSGLQHENSNREENADLSKVKEIRHVNSDVSNDIVYDDRKSGLESNERRHANYVDDEASSSNTKNEGRVEEYNVRSSDSKNFEHQKEQQSEIKQGHQPGSLHSEDHQLANKEHHSEDIHDYSVNRRRDKEKPLMENCVHEHLALQAMCSPQPSKAALRHSSSIGVLDIEGQNNIDQALRGPVVQRRGRFKVTTGDGDEEKMSPAPKATALSHSTKSCGVALSSVLPFMQKIAEHNDIQRDQLVNLIKTLGLPKASIQVSNFYASKSSTNGCHNQMATAPSEREKELLQHLEELQNRASFLVDEIQKGKLINIQLERQLNTIQSKGSGEPK